MVEYTWIDSAGRDVTGTEIVAGYSLRDYFPGLDLDSASKDELAAAYLGPDCDGIGVRWSAL